MKNLHNYFGISLLASVLIFSACSTSRQAAEGGPSEPNREAIEAEEARALRQLLDENRSNLADLQTSDELVVPSVFTQESTASATTTGNPYQGYRIQLISTRDVQEADAISNEFQDWIESEGVGYAAKSYVLFKQPYYRVHVGDFQSKSQAARFTQIVKKEYPDAWVVPDRIIPTNVPASSDTTFSTEKDSSEAEGQFN